MNYWVSRGADKNKLVMGMPMYGQSFTLANTEDSGLNSEANGRGEAGDFTRAGGFLAYYEVRIPHFILSFLPSLIILLLYFDLYFFS